MVRLWKIMFDLVIIMSVGVYSVWGVPLRKIGFVKTNKNLLFKNSKAYPSWKKVIVVTQLFSTRISFWVFLKGTFWQRILPFLICFCFMCLSVRHTLFTVFTGLFAPTSRSPMSKLFRYLESLEKSNGKKWSQIWTHFIKSDV